MLRSKLIRKRLPVFIAAAIAGAGSFAVQAQNQKPVTLEEVVVTAQKREQNLQQVPVSITAYSEFELENKAITSIVELEKSMPNTQFRASRATNSTLTAYIRGVGQQDPLWGFEPGVGVYVDDVYFARPQAAVLDVFDVERIEVLRGPQGTLYGKNTVGGAIKYITKRMQGDASAKVKVAAGNYGQKEITLSGHLPVIEDKLYVGAAVANLQRDGYGEVNTGFDITTGNFNGTEDNYNKDVLVGRVSVEFTPVENLFLNLSADMTDDDSNQPCGSQSSQTALINPGTGLPFPMTGKRYDSDCGTSHISNVENEGFSFTAQYDVSDQVSLKYIFAEREGETQQFIDFEATPLDSFDVPASYTDDQKSHELQVNFKNDFMALIGGVYYFEGNSAGAFDVVLGGTMSGTHNDLGISGDVDTESLSFYFNGNFNITETVTLTAGVRSTEDKKNSNIKRYFLSTTNSYPYSTTQGSGFTFGDPADDTLSLVFTDISDDEAKKSWSEISPTLKVDWQFDENIMLYASYAEGFKSGGFDMRGVATANPDLAKGYDPETVATFEVGVKSQLMDDRLRLNFTVFDSDYKDMQLTVQNVQPAPIFFSSDVLNAGTASIQGAELESLVQITDGLSASLAVGYMNAELDEVISAGVDVSDTWEMLNAPDWNGQFALNYEMDLGSAGKLMFNGATSYRAASRNFNDRTCSCDQQQGYWLVDLGTNWYSDDSHWNAALFVKNLEDKAYKTGGYNLGSGELAFYGPPRTITASLSYQF